MLIQADWIRTVDITVQPNPNKRVCARVITITKRKNENELYKINPAIVQCMVGFACVPLI
jgi:hypothetical protein